jgi:hypothetical protein
MPHPNAVLGEFDGVDLGDERRNARLALLSQALAIDPGLSFPDALQDSAELEAAYRFLNNRNVEPSALLTPHVFATAARVAQRNVVLAVHDTTEFVFGGKSPRAGLEGDRFRAHFCLAVSADGRREPLGVLAIDPWVRTAKKGARTYEERRDEGDLESQRWLNQSIAVEAVTGGTTLIHVEDREADIYQSLRVRLERGMRFIVRAQSYRVLETENGYENMLEHLRAQPRRFERNVVLSRRQVASTKGYQDREGRKAKLAFAATAVTIRPPLKAGPAAQSPLSVNVVHVVEVDAPDGEQAVEWLLVTTESIGNDADIEFVVDAYRARWVIEEYFKALKTGCSYEARQLESYDALRRALAIFSVIAWRLLWTRFLSHHAPTTKAAVVASPAMIAVLRAQRRVPDDPSVDDFLRAVAKLGGHIKNNGPPGWQVLWRGHRKLIDLAAGYAAARTEM